jgi:hypothetical protein
MLLTALIFIHGEQNAQAEPRSVTPITIVGATAYDQGSTTGEGVGDISLDIQQNICETVNDQEILEPFSDAVLGLDIQNRSNLQAQVTHVRYIVRNTQGKRVFRSSRVAASGTPFIDGESTGRITALFLHAAGSQKRFPGATSAIESSLGFRNVRVLVKGKLSNGSRFRRKIRTGFHFADVDRCS